MANFKSLEITGQHPTAHESGGADFTIPIELDLTVAAINDVLEFCDLSANVVVEDYIVINTATSLVFTLGVLNAGNTAVATAWKTGVAAFQRMDSGVPRLGTGKRRVGALVTTALTVAGKVTVLLKCRAA